VSFSPAVKAAALAACGRHCCICHKFCGTKIECHHILHEAEARPDTFENCIPVCFDCHADMRSYDFKHPKGTKYTPDELRQHRERWYEKVAAGGGLTPFPEHVAVDKEVFRAFQELVPYYPALDYLKGRNFAGFSFERSPLDAIFRYAYYADRVEYEFLDPELEAARGEFVDAARRFARLISENTWPTHLTGCSTVPPEWEREQPDRFDRAVTDIHESANAIERAYAQIVRLARRRLGVVGVIEPTAPDV
jgi:hypothetical protein